MVDTRVASSYVQLLQEYLVRQGLDPLRVLADVPLNLRGEVSDTRVQLQLGLQGGPLAAVSR